MKKRRISLALVVGLMMMSLVACGGKENSTNAENVVGKVETPAVEPEEVVVVTPEPAEPAAPVEEEIVIEPEEEAEPIEEEPVVAELPEDRVWVDDLYNKLVAFDVDGVVAIITAPDIFEKAAPYAYTEWNKWEFDDAYKLITTDGNIVGIMHYKDSGSIYAFLSTKEETDYGFDGVYDDDICIYMSRDTVGWCDGEGNYLMGGYPWENEYPDMPWMVWHY